MKLLKNKGFTLIELLLYIALITIFLGGAVRFSWDISYGREKANQQQTVHLSAESVMARILYEIRKAKSISSVVGSQLVLLDPDGSTTTIGLTSGVVYITTSSSGPYALSSNQIIVTSLLFSNITPTVPNAANIHVTLTAEQSSNILKGQVKASDTLTSSAELNSQFSQSRSLLIDTTNANLDNFNKQLLGTTLENTGSSTITIDKMSLSWTGTASGSLVQSISIGGSSVWTGSGVSGSVLDITNISISAGSVVNLTNITFSLPMDGTTMTATFVLIDGSTAAVVIIFPAAVTPTPTTIITPTNSPTSSPTPSLIPTPTTAPRNCNEHCQQKYGKSGSCTKASNCSGYNEGQILNCKSNICCCQ